MSSSQRSSTPSTPKWRSSLSNPRRQRPATSVSLVFAQPEQGSKLASAIDKLPIAAIDDAASFMSQGSRKRERTQSQASSFTARIDPHIEQSNGGQAVLREGEDASRKRSKLSVEVSDASAPANNTVELTSPTETQVDHTQCPQPSTLPPESLSHQEEANHDADLRKDTSSSSLLPQITVPFPNSEAPNITPAPKSSSTRSSWFGFGKVKGDESESTIPAKSKDNAQSPSTAGVGGQIPSSGQFGASQAESSGGGVVETAVPPSPSVSATPTPARSISANEKPTAAMSFTSAQYSPPNQRINSNATSISSVDEEVPKPRSTSIDNTATTISPQAIIESPVTKTADRKPSISSLNPSSSRFTLKLPLLGRPKIPLEQAVAVAQAEDIREPHKTTESATASDDQAGASSSRAPAKHDSAPAVIHQETTAHPSSEQDVQEQSPTVAHSHPDDSRADESADARGANDEERRASSWWDYLAWVNRHAENPSKDSQHGKDSADRNGTAGAVEQPSAPSSVDSSQSEPQQPPQSPELPPPSERIVPAEMADATSATQKTVPQTRVSQDQKEGAKPSSIFSGETVKSHSSAWYSPWAWYSGSSAPASTTQVETSGATPEPSTTLTEAPKTESEMVKERALAREQASHAETTSESAKALSSSTESPVGESTPKAEQDESTPKAPTASSEPVNPIQSSVANNKSSWMSLFMSKALTIKSVTNESHDQKDDGMEVMEVDEEPQPSAAIAIPTGKDVQRVAAASSLKSSSPAPSSPVPPSTPKSPTGKTPVPPPPKEREPRKPDPPAEPLTESDSIKRETTKGGPRSPSPTPSKASGTTPPSSARPNFVLPTWEDTFHSPPRSFLPPRSQSAKSKLTGALSYVAGALFSKDERAQGKGKGKERETPGLPPEFLTFGQELPKALDVIGEQLNPYILNGGCRVVVIGIAGWSPGAVTRTLAGGFPSSSSKFVNMTAQALEQFAEENGFKFKKITKMALEGDGTIRKKVSRVYNHLVNNDEWMEDLHAADVIFVTSHSQGAIISTHLIDRLIEDGHILTSRSVDTLAKSAAAIAGGGPPAVPTTQAQKVCLLALCGIHLGPLRYLKTSSLLQPYIQYVENAAARELFEFQDTESKLSKNYIGALRNVMDHGAKVVYIASLNDQVVPIYSGLFTAASHPRILRALYIDNDAYHSSDFLSNLLILLIRILNAGLSDRGLLAHLSEATAGTLSGVGHSTAYEELATYSLAVKYFFMTNDGTGSDVELVINPFNAVEEQNDYEIPWLLRDMIADTKIAHFFAREFGQLRDAFDDWQPKTTILREVKKKLQPITRLSPTQLSGTSSSKL